MRVHPGKENKRQCHLIPSFPHHQFDAPNRGKIFLREFPKSRFISDRNRQYSQSPAR